MEGNGLDVCRSDRCLGEVSGVQSAGSLPRSDELLIQPILNHLGQE